MRMQTGEGRRGSLLTRAPAPAAGTASRSTDRGRRTPHRLRGAKSPGAPPARPASSRALGATQVARRTRRTGRGPGRASAHGGRSRLPVVSEGVDDPPEMLPLQPLLLRLLLPAGRQHPGLLRLPPPPLLARRGRLLPFGLAASTVRALPRPRQLLPLLLVAPPQPPAHRLGRRVPLGRGARRQRRLRFAGHSARGRHPRNHRRQRSRPARTLPRSLPARGGGRRHGARWAVRSGRESREKTMTRRRTAARGGARRWRERRWGGAGATGGSRSRGGRVTGQPRAVRAGAPDNV